ncbi:MAG: LacI family transcriptional regulator [Spirochaetia bacterium]|nr:LacI family transcriptional regulator [Spirochaetia bacterium]
MTSKKKRITAAEIAAIAGVSRSTVTGVINDYPFIAEKTKKEVRAVIDAYGYVPNSAARVLVGMQPKIIGHFIYGQTGKLHNTYIESLMVDVIEAARLEGYSVVTSIITEDRPDQVVKFLQNGTIQGAIVTGGSHDEKETESLLSVKFPVVFVNKYPASFNVSRFENKHIVKSDNFKGGYDATSYLIAKGHRDIMHIAGLHDRLSACDRLEGFRKAFLDHGIPLREERILEGDYTIERAQTLFDTCIQQGDLPTAVFATNDMTAIGVMRSCRAHGISIPQDLSLIGFDDLLLAANISPALTTMKAGNDSLAMSAVSVLIEALEDDGIQPKVRILEPVLIERESVRALN